MAKKQHTWDEDTEEWILEGSTVNSFSLVSQVSAALAEFNRLAAFSPSEAVAFLE